MTWQGQLQTYIWPVVGTKKKYGSSLPRNPDKEGGTVHDMQTNLNSYFETFPPYTYWGGEVKTFDA